MLENFTATQYAHAHNPPPDQARAYAAEAVAAAHASEQKAAALSHEAAQLQQQLAAMQAELQAAVAACVGLEQRVSSAQVAQVFMFACAVNPTGTIVRVLCEGWKVRKWSQGD